MLALATSFFSGARRLNPAVNLSSMAMERGGEVDDGIGSKDPANVDRRREDVWAAEAEALLDEIFRWLEERPVGDGLAKRLEQSFATVVEGAVRKALAGPEVTKTIRSVFATGLSQDIEQALGQLGERLNERLGGKISLRVAQEIAAAFESDVTKRLEANLGKRIQSGIETAFANHLASLEQRLKDAAAHVGAAAREADRRPRVGREAAVGAAAERRTQEEAESAGDTELDRYRSGRRRREVAAVVGFLVVITGVVTWQEVRLRRFRPMTGGTQVQQTVTPVASSSAAAESPAETLSANPAPRLVWEQIAGSAPANLAPPAGSVDPFDCWFGGDQGSIALSAALKRARSGEALPHADRLLPKCTAPAATPGLAIYGAQEAVTEFFATPRGAQCPTKAPDGKRPALALDGKPGSNTTRALNDYLACRGLDQHVVIANDSPVISYLLALHALLGDLGGLE